MSDGFFLVIFPPGPTYVCSTPGISSNLPRRVRLSSGIYSGHPCETTMIAFRSSLTWRR
jgi:hypothetical protein